MDGKEVRPVEDEKIAVDKEHATYNEKATLSNQPELEYAEDTGRRQSVALNIIENPLRVSCIAHYVGDH